MAMESFGPNPMVIEDDDLDQAPSHQLTPLILIHDGSGLIFSYFSLPKFNRPVYGLYDPHFFNSETWEGGLQEQAAHYWDLIKDQVPSGNVVLGGWSLGGIIALQMFLSRKEAASEYTVTGILMLDSVCPTTLQPEYMHDSDGSEATSKTTISYTPRYDSHTSATTRKHITDAGQRTEQLIQAWAPPVWSHSMADEAPPIVMLRAVEYVPLHEDDIKASGHQEPEGLIYAIDSARERHQLGWEDVHSKFCRTVLEIPGHHYSILDTENIDELSRQMQRALKIFKT